MALTQNARNKIKSFVQATKKLLMNEFEGQLQQYFGIHLDGNCLMVEELTSKDTSIIQTARLLRERLKYLEETIAGTNKKEEAVEQLIREQAFTILNRFAAMRMAEERNIIQESIRKGYNSEGYLVFDQLTGGAKTADQYARYTWYIKAVFDELAIDLPAVFDRFSPYALLFPSERVLLDLLAIINDEDLAIFREEGHQPINLWKEDETIGWVYQYYNSKEEIRAMRDESDAPRNSRELAVRNQFFTPRYVVQFLVDNSLGRQWYEMTKGNTKLTNQCQYMVKRPDEVFLHKGEQLPQDKNEETHYIEYRELKDPRNILMLDPACGSMHFGLYSFDLYEQIYKEAWDNHPEIMPELRDKYLREEFIRQIPEMIIRHNIHGVDIDPRAIQIAGLSLWLRAQKSYDDLNLRSKDRPSISKSNLVVAEPMPGDAQMLSEFTKSLPGPIGKLVRVIWDKMKSAGETGMLLKIEEELKKEIEIAKQEWKEFKKTSSQTALFDSPKESKIAEMAAIYGKGQKINKDFFDTAEKQVLEALKNFAENAEGEHAFQKLLFAEDTARGFAFIEFCRKHYDVIVMNPPFGAGSISTEQYYKDNYPTWGKNILCCFFSRMNGLLIRVGNIGAIFDRTVIIKSSYEDFRKENAIGKIFSVADTGWGVLDANVETTVFVTGNSINGQDASFIDLRNTDNKSGSLLEILDKNKWLTILNNVFDKLPNSVIGYDWSKEVLELFKSNKNLIQNSIQARQGHALVSFNHFRYFWEVVENKDYKYLYNGGGFCMFYMPYREMTLIGEDHKKVKNHKSVVLRNLEFQFLSGIGYGKRGDILDAHILRKGFVFTSEGQAIHDLDMKTSLDVLGYLNSSSSQYLINLYCGQHKHAGYINLLPYIKIKNGEENRNNLLKILRIKHKWYSLDETTLDFNSFLHVFNDQNFTKSIENLLVEYDRDKLIYKDLVKRNDEFWLMKTKMNQEDTCRIEDKRPNEELLDIFKQFSSVERKQIIAKEILQHLVGVVFGRFDINTTDYIQIDNLNMFSEYGDLKKQKGDQKQFFLSSELASLTSDKLSILFTNSDVTTELENILSTNSIHDYFQDIKSFFDYHFNRYSPNRREAPIYWPLSTPSCSFIIWIYYPELMENTLYGIVNELLDTKLRDVKKEVSDLKMSVSTKELNDKKEFLHELEDFKEEVLRITRLPYKPNQDDGVLITAAPLYNLFQHPKWRKSTEDCWKKLEKGEYDWAHLAYSIWPDRVRQKCKKDLSLAIAHGLEDICEVKPKEKKEIKKIDATEIKQGKLL